MSTADLGSRTFTREEFYDYVWSKPATRLAAELGCSDVLIGKICKAYDIPKPYPGYWAKLENGQKPRRRRLSTNADPELQTLTFRSEQVTAPKVQELPRELSYDDDVREVLAIARELGTIVVAETLHKPHSHVRSTRERLKQLKDWEKIPWSQRPYSDRDELPPGLAIEVSNNLLGRALRIMDALVKRIEALKGAVEFVPHKYGRTNCDTVITICGEIIGKLRLREKHNQVPVKKDKSRYSWEDNQTELIPSGLLLFDQGPSYGDKPLAMDGKVKKLESKLSDLVISFIVRAGEGRLRRRDDEELARRRAEDARLAKQRAEELQIRRDALERLQAEELEKVTKLLGWSDAWHKSKQLREFIDAFCWFRAPDGIVRVDGRLAEYLRWAFAQADRLDPLRPRPHSILDEKVDS